MKRFLSLAAVVVALLAAYLVFWPVPIEPQAWEAPDDPGYTGDFAPNDRLAAIERIDIGDHTGPEDAAFGPDGRLYVTSHEGAILAVDPETRSTSVFAETDGRPLGLEFADDGTLYIADAYRGLMRINSDGSADLLADTTDEGSPILYADDLDIGGDGVIWFSDASTKFGAEANGGTLPASLLDLMEHGGHGRILRHDPADGTTTVAADGLTFANGIALTADGRHLLAIETGTYSVWKYAITENGLDEGQQIVTNLPGFPDNINRNPDGTFWLGLVSPRSAAADSMSESPFLRRLTMRLPAALRPKPQRYGFVVKIDKEGSVLETLQDSSGGYALTTGAIEAPDGSLFITSLTEPDLAVLPR